MSGDCSRRCCCISTAKHCFVAIPRQLSLPAPRASDNILDGVGDVLRLQPLHALEAFHGSLLDLSPQMSLQLGVHHTRFYRGDAHMALGHLLTQGFAESHHPELGEVVDPYAGASDTACH